MTSEDALLPVSSMINNYCRKMTSCDQDYAVLSIMASLERTIGYRCDASGKKFEKVLLALRAIGNAGHASRAVGPITKCLTSDSNPLEIRVAAAEAFRRMPCDAKVFIFLDLISNIFVFIDPLAMKFVCNIVMDIPVSTKNDLQNLISTINTRHYKYTFTLCKP